MNSIFSSYLPKFRAELSVQNEDVIIVSASYFSPQGDAYVVDTRVLSPRVIQTTQSLQELEPEVSSVYPYKIVPPTDFDGSTVILSPTITTDPTASQNYYTPIYFERYTPAVIYQIDTRFTELSQFAPIDTQTEGE
jgi:hypothetical protein